MIARILSILKIYLWQKKLKEAIVNTGSKPFILFASSTQELKDNPYGRGKKEARELLAKWASKNDAKFSGLIIPNVFGPFGLPYYNSVVATFCYQLNNNEKPEIHVDSEISLIYVHNLAKEILAIISAQKIGDQIHIEPQISIKVTEILSYLKNFKKMYIDNYQIPALKSSFEVELFNTFRSYINPDKYPFYIEKHEDNRGFLSEVVKEKTGGQIFFSTTKPGISRGNHFHTRKIERFCVVKGEAIIRLRKIGSDKIYEYQVSGKMPSFVDMPIWYTHSITNSGNEEVLTLFWCNEIFNKEDADTYFEEV